MLSFDEGTIYICLIFNLNVSFSFEWFRTRTRFENEANWMWPIGLFLFMTFAQSPSRFVFFLPCLGVYLSKSASILDQETI